MGARMMLPPKMLLLACIANAVTYPQLTFCNRTEFMKDVVSWNVIISGHAGLVKEGKNIFQAMHGKHNLEPELEHYACLLEPRNAANYIVLCDIRAHSSRWGDSGKTRSMMSDTGLKRTPGCSWVEVEIRVQPSRVGDYNYPSPT
ncbi:hypothetical protein ACFX2K_001225 [Malus domestica]